MYDNPPGNSKEPPKMTNFAPICTITGTSKSGQLPNPTNLLQGTDTRYDKFQLPGLPSTVEHSLKPSSISLFWYF